MNFIDITKKAVSLTVMAGVSKIVHDIIANNVDMEKSHHKVTVPVASFALGGMAADAASEYTDNFIDEIADIVVQIKKRFQK